MILSVRLKGGDFAPDIVFTEILSAGAAGPCSSANLSGRLTVLTFLPVSHNLTLATKWNALVDQFADKAQFAWITAEYQPAVRPWLREHWLKGWVFLDPLGATKLSYGMEEPVAVIIGTDRRIFGFDHAVLPTARTLDAAIEGRVTTDISKELPPPLDRPGTSRPDSPPSETVHISPARSESGTILSTSDDHWAALGFTLKGLLAEAFGVLESHMDVAPDLDSGARYDVALVLPSVESRGKIARRIRRAIERQFGLHVSRETRSMDIYVLSARDRRILATPSTGCVVFETVPAAEMRATTPDLQSDEFPFPVRHLPAIGRGFQRLAPPVLPFSRGCLFVSETQREGYCAIDVLCVGNRTDEELLERLGEETGIVAKRERREVQMLVVR
jgi:hypothetical protein